MQHALDPKAPRTPKALGVAVTDAVEQVLARALSIDPKQRQKDASELARELKGAEAVAFGRPPIDLGTTARQGQQQPQSVSEPPSTDPAPNPSAAPPPNLGGLKETVRMSSPSPPVPSPSAGQLFQSAAVAPPPGVPVPEPSASVMGLSALGVTRVEPMMVPDIVVPENNPQLQTTKQPLSERSALRAQWLVGLLVFILVLGAGAVALHFWLLR
jgi:hypothetical protein